MSNIQAQEQHAVVGMLTSPKRLPGIVALCARRALGLDSRELSKLLGCSVWTVWWRENFCLELPRQYQLALLALVLLAEKHDLCDYPSIMKYLQK